MADSNSQRTSADSARAGRDINVTTIYQSGSTAPASLAERIYSKAFLSLIKDRIRNFVGREYLSEAVAQIIRSAENVAGYIIIRGEPGIGKTSFAAHLVDQFQYIHHFNISAQNIKRTRQFLGNTCAQLIVKYALPYTSIAEESLNDSGLLTRLLDEASSKAKSEPVVVVIDALDEAEQPPTSYENRLCLPPSLPDGVFILITCRDEEDLHLAVDSSFDLYISDDDPNNLKDIKLYISREIGRYKQVFEAQLQKWNITQSDFVDILTERSQGNFMYIIYSLDDIRAGRLDSEAINDPRRLPRGLRGYYQRNWRLMQSIAGERFNALLAPLACLLASARDAVTAEDLRHWLRDTNGTKSLLDVRSLVREWRQFLNVTTNANGEELYRIYHPSFGEFLEAEVGLKPYHARIAESALSRLGLTNS